MNRRPDIIVLDINMPVMDGLDTLSQMMEINSAVPVIINTAYISYKESFTFLGRRTLMSSKAPIFRN